MRRRKPASSNLAVTAAAMLAMAAFVPVSATVAGAQQTPPRAIVSPFGPGYDPTRPPPQDPTDAGPGIVSASVVSAGPAEVEELRRKGIDTSNLFAVLLQVDIAAGSTTAPLRGASVYGKPAAGEPVPLYAACAPTAGDGLSVFQGAGSGLREWHVAVGGQAFYCGGRNARLAVEIGEGGIRLIAKEAWQGPLLLLFKTAPGVLRQVVLPGVQVELPMPTHSEPAARGRQGKEIER